jgi:hypothetical protein
MICSTAMVYYFSKQFHSDGLEKVDYYRCSNCGFCASKNHLDMSEADWTHLNTSWHNANNLREDNPWNRSQRHFHQELMIHLLNRHNVISEGNWLDYASGQGGLSLQLQQHFDLVLHSFDKFIRPSSFPVTQQDIVKRGYTLVTNTAMFEHVRSRDTLDEIESYVANDGCFAIHTLVRGDIPADTQWMYFLPVHCAFFTNKSMSLLMQQWGYSCSIYNQDAKLWVWFKASPRQIAKTIEQLNQKMGWQYLHFKEGFMDFWP